MTIDTSSLPILHEGDKGLAVEAAKRGVYRWKGWASYLALNTVGRRTFGRFFVPAVVGFQKAHKLRQTGDIDRATWKALLPYLDAKAVSLLPKPAPPADPAIVKARAMLAFCRQFDNTYDFGGEHDSTLADDSPHGLFDCSSSTSLMLYHAGILGATAAQVSTWFESYGQPGRGRYVTIHANADHVWTEFNLPSSAGPDAGYHRFDTSPHGDGLRGPRVRTLRRSDSGFWHRHPDGL